MLQDMVDAEKAAKSGKKVKKKKKKKKKGGKKRKGKKKKDPTADRALEHLYVEMVSNGILQQPLKVLSHDCLMNQVFSRARGKSNDLKMNRNVWSCTGTKLLMIRSRPKCWRILLSSS
jgi:hypothetical protein